MNKIIKGLLMLVILAGSFASQPKAYAEVITVTGRGSYTLGDGSSESIDIAKMRAKEDALNNARKQAGVYVESLSIVQSGQLTSDEISTLTADLLNAQGEPKYNAEVLDNDIICYHCELTAQVDTDSVTPQMMAESRKNCQHKLDEAEKCFDRGTAYLRGKEYQLAIAELDKSIILYSKNANAYNNRGNAYAALHDYQKAIENYIQAVSINSQDEDFYNNLGNAYLKTNQYAKAISYYDKVIEINPRCIDAYLKRGTAYYFLRDYRKSLADMDKILMMDSNNKIARECRGELVNVLGS